MTVSQLVRPHRPSCLLGQLNKAFGDRLLLCGEIDPNLLKSPLEDMGREKSPNPKERILLSGDIESNPGPRRSIAEKGPTAEEKLSSLEATLSNYEAKVSGLEHEIETQKEDYEKKLFDFTERLESIEKTLKEAKEESDKKYGDNEKTFVEELEKMKEEMRAKFSDVSTKVDSLNENLKNSDDGGKQKFTKVEENFNALQNALRDIQSDNSKKIERVVEESRNSKDMLAWMEGKIKDSKVEYTGKIHEIAHVAREQRREYKSKFLEVETETARLKDRLETMNHILDEMQEKMYEFEQNKKNNLIFNGILPDHPETPDGLTQKVASLIKTHVSIKRELPITKASRVYSGPEVRGTRPVLVTFESFKDRDEILRKARMLKKANVHVEEDLSKRTRENRTELRKFMRQVRKANPEKNCFLQYDKLYIDSKIFVYNEILGQVVEHTESVRYGEMLSRPGSMMMGPMQGGYAMSRPTSRTGSRPTSGAGGRGDSSSGVPKLPPLNRNHSMSLPSMVDYVDPRDVKLNELEKVINQYQDKLNDVTNSYQQKIGILENKIVDKELERGYST